MKSNQTTRRKFFTQTGLIAAGLALGIKPAISSYYNFNEKEMDRKSGGPPCIMVCFSWSHNGIGDIGMTPALLHLFQQYIPEAEIIVVNLTKASVPYLKERFPDCRYIPSPFNHTAEEIPEDFHVAFNRADMLLYASGTTLSYGRWDRDWNRTMRLAMPLFMARSAGKPYGIYGQSFEKFAWPSNELFVPMLSDASFVYCRDTKSLEYIKSLGVKSPILEFSPDQTFAFNLHDKHGANAIMQKYGLKPRRFITITIRTVGTNPEKLMKGDALKRMQVHDSKICKIIETYIKRTGNNVLICPENNIQLEPTREHILQKLPKEILGNVRFKEELLMPDEGFELYAQAEVVVSMEMHSVILALAAGTPVLHPQFWESGRKAWMLKDLGMEEWLFDIDEESVDQMLSELMEIHNNFDTARGKVESAMEIVHKRQRETMAIVRQTLMEAVKTKKSQN